MSGPVDVLDDIAEQDAVEARVVEREARDVSTKDHRPFNFGEGLAGDLDGGLGVVDPGDLRAPRGACQQHLAPAATRVEHGLAGLISISASSFSLERETPRSSSKRLNPSHLSDRKYSRL